jgi:outer membrane protein assembly factor BamB
MKRVNPLCVIAGCLLLGTTGVRAQDWPQWRGPNRDARATGFKAPKTWPRELTQKWKVTVGDGVATPSLVGNRLYVFSRENGNEVLRCLDAATGKEQWWDKYQADGATGAARSFSGPRSSPTVADGKVVTLGVRGTLSCYDAATGKLQWRKDDYAGSYPRFFVSSSPIVVHGLCIAQLGGSRNGGVIAYDLATGKEKWKWTGDGPGYASPSLLTLGDTGVLVAETDRKIVGINAADGKLLWQTPFAVRGRGYNASTPMVAGQTIIYSGSSRGTRAVKLEKKGDTVTATEVWSNPSVSAQFNTPVVKDGLVFGLTDRDSLFCLSAKDGKTAWTEPIGGGGRRSGYGSIVDAGPVLLALTPASQLIVFEPTDKGFKKVASYKVASGSTYAYPVAVGNRIYVKDRDSVILWTVD